MDRKIRRLQLAMEADLKDFYDDKKSYAFGMEFVVLLCDNLVMPLTCTLCTKVGILSNMLAHMNSIGHQVKVLEKTFPSILQQARDLYTEKDRNFKRLIADIAREIESYLGHQQPFATSMESYKENPKLLNGSLNHEPAPSRLIKKLTKIISDDRASAKRKREQPKSPMKVESPARKKSKKESQEVPRRESRWGSRSELKWRSHGVLKKEPENEMKKDSRSKPKKDAQRRSEERSRGRSNKDTRREKGHRERSHRTPTTTKKAHREPNDKKGKRTHSQETSRSSKKMKVELPSVERQQARSSTEAQLSSRTIDDYMRHLADEQTKLNLIYCRYSKCPQLHPRYQEEWNDFWLNEFYKIGNSAAPGTLCHVDMADFTAQWNVHWPKRLIAMKEEDVLELRVNTKTKFGIPIKQSDRDELKQIIMERKVKLNKKQPVVPIVSNCQKIDVAIPPAPIKSLIDLSEISSSIGQHINLMDKLQSSLAEADISSFATLIPPPNPLGTITNEDMTALFGRFNGLSVGVKNNLFAVMENLRVTDIERYNMILESPVIDAEKPEENPAEENPAEENSADDVTAEDLAAAESSGTIILSDADDDDYWLGKLAKVAKKEEAIIIISDDEGDKDKKKTEPTFDISSARKPNLKYR